MMTTFRRNCIKYVLAAGPACVAKCNIHDVEGFSPMLKYYIKTTEALKRLHTDTDGVVSFEYIIVAFCIVAAVAAVFGTANANGISSALNTALGHVTSAFNTATTATP